MLNIDETLEITTYYSISRDFGIRALNYSGAVVTFIEILRGQVPEINLLQLIPGFYLLLLFTSFLLLVLFSNLLGKLPIQIELQKSFGIKTITRNFFYSSGKLGIFLFLLIFTCSLKTVIPISLDSFNSYGEKTLENTWSFNEVLGLENFLLFILFILSQIPVLLVSFFTTETEINKLPKIWKPLTLSIFIISAFLTPTIDGYTQLSFSISGLSIYFLTIILIEKRQINKFFGNSIIGF